MTTPRRYVGVDIGGTKIAAGLIDGGGQLLQRAVSPTPDHGAAAVLDVVAGLIGHLVSAGPAAAVGVGAPGVIDPTLGRVVSATEILPGWAGTDVRAGLEQRTGMLVTVDNDVRAMAYGEARCGAASSYADALFVSVGTGVGGAWYRAGQLARGPHGTGGEIAHLLVPSVGPVPCGCGRRDHLEAVAAGPAIAAAYADRTGVAGRSLRDVAARLRRGDPDARAVVSSAATMLGRALAGLVSAVDTSVVVIGGGVTEIGDDYLQPVRDALKAEVLPPLRTVPVLRAALGTDAALIGAALLAAAAQTMAASA